MSDNNTKFTPGEWIASRFDPDSPWIVVSAAGEWVCKVSSDSRWAGQTPEREEANARHIADLHNANAALMAERERLREALEFYGSPSNWQWRSPVPGASMKPRVDRDMGDLARTVLKESANG